MSDINQDWTEEAKERHRQIGLDWVTDSRLEKWFPFTAEELTTLRERVRELEEANKAWSEECLKKLDALAIAFARIRELEEAMPTCVEITTIAAGCAHPVWLRAVKIIERIERVMKPKEKNE